ncbi:MAG: hypothetical protein GY857_08315 [Desulfobacula sp.]|nr:hypothetical protein [Desulfobacula sp.]
MNYPGFNKLPAPWEKRVNCFSLLLIVILGILTLILPDPVLTFWFNPPPELKVSLGWAKWIVGPAFIIFGLYFFLKIYNGPIPKEMGYFECIGCGKVVRLDKDMEYSCQECSGSLDGLEGFFDRHPEFKDEGS